MRLCAGLSGAFTVSRQYGRISDFRLNIIQADGLVPVGFYDHLGARIQLYQPPESLWLEGIPSEMPFCIEVDFKSNHTRPLIYVIASACAVFGCRTLFCVRVSMKSQDLINRAKQTNSFTASQLTERRLK